MRVRHPGPGTIPLAKIVDRPVLKGVIMRVFVTGATGFIGSALVPELLAAGHQVVGLARSDEAAALLTATGAEVHRGDLDDPECLRNATAVADGVIHTAFNHDPARYAASALSDQRAVATLGEALTESGRPLVVASGLAGLNPDRVSTEEDTPAAGGARLSEETAMSFVERGVRVSVVRLAASVHGKGDHGSVPELINVARAKGVSAYLGDGANRWPAVHRFDAARLFRLALEAAPTGARLHGIAEEGVSIRDIAETIGRNLNLPSASVPLTQAVDHFGWLGGFLSMDASASSILTEKLLGWRPAQPGLIEDLEQGHYFTKVAPV